jgi:hypothetical protein
MGSFGQNLIYSTTPEIAQNPKREAFFKQFVYTFAERLGTSAGLRFPPEVFRTDTCSRNWSLLMGR